MEGRLLLGGVRHGLLRGETVELWVVSFALLLATLVVPAERFACGWRLRAVLAVPTVLVVLRFVVAPRVEAAELDAVLSWVAVGVYGCCVPAILYVAGSVLNPELTNIRKRPIVVALACVVGAVALAAYGMGAHHELFLDDFAVSGNMVPK